MPRICLLVVIVAARIFIKLAQKRTNKVKHVISVKNGHAQNALIRVSLFPLKTRHPIKI
jgi:hypothetical protein